MEPIQTRKATDRLILYHPHKKQLEFHNSKERFVVSIWGRQSGKSTGAVNDALKFGWENPGTTTWFLCPTYDQAKIMYRRLVGMLWPCKGVLLKKNQTELRIKLINQSQIVFKSGESLDNLRGETLHRAYIDEVRDQHQELWPLVIRPMLSTTRGSCRFISTPNGFDFLYDLFTQAQSDTTGQWKTIQAPSTANPLITEKELADAKRTMTEAQFAQEYLAEFRDLTSGKAYVNFGEHNLRLDNPFWADGLVHPLLPILVAPDFNLSPMAWNLGQKKIDQFFWFDEVWLKSSHTQEAAKVLVGKLMSLHPNIHKVGVLLCGDATAKAGQRAAAGQSDYDILCQALDAAKIPWNNLTPDSNPTVKDRVNTMNAKFKDAAGVVSQWIHPINCPMLKRDCERVVWKPTGSDTIILDQTTNKDLTHSSDGVGYAVSALSPLVYNASLPTLKVIIRQ